VVSHLPRHPYGSAFRTSPFLCSRTVFLRMEHELLVMLGGVRCRLLISLSQNTIYRNVANIEVFLMFSSAVCFLLQAGFLLGSPFIPEHRGDMFLRNVGWLPTDYAALYPRRQISTAVRTSNPTYHSLLPIMQLSYIGSISYACVIDSESWYETKSQFLCFPGFHPTAVPGSACVLIDKRMKISCFPSCLKKTLKQKRM
jgi:hypothetical protein